MTRPVRLAAVTLLLASTRLSAAFADDTQIAMIAPPAEATANIPDDTELERRHAHIGRVDVRVDDVFEHESYLAAPYRVANGLHVSTRETTVAEQLLFHTGETYDRRVIDETERLLRAQRYLNAATIEPVAYNEADNTVDVMVRVHDVWTLSPGFSFGRKGGQNKTNLEFEDTNFLGLGKQLSLSRSSDVDRTSWRLAYTDPNVLGSWWRLQTAYSSMSDGFEHAFALARPFYSLDTHWAANAAASDTLQSVSRYALGERTERFDMQERQMEVGGGWSEGLRDGWVRRYIGGFRYDGHEFAARPDDPTASIPTDRVVAYPWVGMEWIEDAYVQTRNLDQIGRTEDLYLGRKARIEAGWSSGAFGATRDELVLNGTAQAGTELGDNQFLINSLAMHGRLAGGDIENGLFELTSRYYYRQSQQRVLFASLTGSLASNLDPEEQLMLGGDNGLRGYPLRYQAGTAGALVTLEERFYTNWQPLKLVNVGAAVFFDAGRMWGHDEFAPPPLGWLKDVGFGLRLGSARSGLGNVVHIDLAFPLDGGKDINSMQLLIETRKSF